MAGIGKSVWRGLVAFLSFSIPVLFMSFPTWENLTIGSIMFAILHFIEKKATA